MTISINELYEPGKHVEVLNIYKKPHVWEPGVVKHVNILVTKSSEHFIYNVLLDRKTSCKTRNFPEGKPIVLNVTNSRIRKIN